MSLKSSGTREIDLTELLVQRVKCDWCNGTRVEYHVSKYGTDTKSCSRCVGEGLILNKRYVQSVELDTKESQNG